MPPLLHFFRVKPRHRIFYSRVSLLAELLIFTAGRDRSMITSKTIWDYFSSLLLHLPCNHRLKEEETILFERTGWWEKTIWRTKENVQPTNWLQNRKLNSSHRYTDENRVWFLSIQPLCVPQVQLDGQNQCNKCYLVDFRGEIPCLFLSVFINTLLKREAGQSCGS